MSFACEYTGLARAVTASSMRIAAALVLATFLAARWSGSLVIAAARGGFGWAYTFAPTV